MGVGIHAAYPDYSGGRVHRCHNQEELGWEVEVQGPLEEFSPGDRVVEFFHVPVDGCSVLPKGTRTLIFESTGETSPKGTGGNGTKRKLLQP